MYKDIRKVHTYTLYAVNFLSMKYPATNFACNFLFTSSFSRLNIVPIVAKDTKQYHL